MFHPVRRFLATLAARSHEELKFWVGIHLAVKEAANKEKKERSATGEALR
jgi:hypothetical protein